MQEISVAQISMQPGGSTDLSTQLNEKRPPITVDKNGGLFFLSTGWPGAHTLVSGDDRASCGSFNGYTVQCRYTAHSRAYSQQNSIRRND